MLSRWDDVPARCYTAHQSDGSTGNSVWSQTGLAASVHTSFIRTIILFLEHCCGNHLGERHKHIDWLIDCSFYMSMVWLIDWLFFLYESGVQTFYYKINDRLFVVTLTRVFLKAIIISIPNSLNKGGNC